MRCTVQGKFVTSLAGTQNPSYPAAMHDAAIEGSNPELRIGKIVTRYCPAHSSGTAVFSCHSIASRAIPNPAERPALSLDRTQSRDIRICLWISRAATTMVCIREATMPDLLAMQRCNLLCLPENYQLKVCEHAA